MASVALAAIGCDAQVTPDYEIERTELFTGEIISHLEHPYSEAQVALVWVTDELVHFQVVIDTIELSESGTTPFDLVFDGIESPDVLADCTLDGRHADENHLGFGWIAVALQGVLPDTPVPLARLIELRRDQMILGFAEDHVLVWVGEEMTPDSKSAQILSGTFPPGAYVMAGRDSLGLAPLGSKVKVDLSDPSGGFAVPFFPWQTCSVITPPAEVQRSPLKVDVKIDPARLGTST